MISQADRWMKVQQNWVVLSSIAMLRTFNAANRAREMLFWARCEASFSNLHLSCGLKYLRFL